MMTVRFHSTGGVQIFKDKKLVEEILEDGTICRFTGRPGKEWLTRIVTSPNKCGVSFRAVIAKHEERRFAKQTQDKSLKFDVLKEPPVSVPRHSAGQFALYSYGWEFEEP